MSKSEWDYNEEMYTTMKTYVPSEKIVNQLNVKESLFFFTAKAIILAVILSLGTAILVVGVGDERENTVSVND
jgi:hypothetical protein